MRAKFGVLEQTSGVHLPAKFCLGQFILLPSGGVKLEILLFIGLQHFVMSPIGGI